MKKFISALKKYYIISFIIAIIFVAYGIIGGSRNSTILLYLLHIVEAIIGISLMLTPIIAFFDLCIVQVAKSLFNDYIKGDRRERILIVTVIIIMLLRKICVWIQ